MALADVEQVVQQHLQLSKEQREIEDDFHRREQHELAALEAAKQAVDDQCREERESMIAQLPTQSSLPAAFEKILAEKRDALIALKEETYRREKAERQKRLDDEKRKLSHRWTTLLPESIVSASGLNLGDIPRSVPAPQPSRPPAQAPPRVNDGRSYAVEAPPRVIEAPNQPAPRPAFPQPGKCHVPTTSFRPHNQPIQSQHAPYQQPNGSFQMPPASRQFPSPFPHTTHAHSLPTPPTVPSQQIPPPQHRKPLPTGSQHPPTRFQQQLAVPQQPPSGHLSTDRNVAEYPPGPVVVERPPPSGSVLPRILNGAEPAVQGFVGGPPGVSLNDANAHEPSRALQSGPSEARPPAHVVPIMEPSLPAPSPSQLHQTPLLKRRAEDAPGPEDPQSKRVRTEGAEDSQSPESRLSASRPKGGTQRTITFDEVYGDGNAKYKHHIVEYPAHSAKFYILRCDEHGVHFNANPLAGAAKHLHSAQHGNMSKERAQAVELLGYQVIDCTMELAKKNNELFNRLLATKEYQPLNMNQASKTKRRSMGFKDTPDVAPAKVASEPPPPPPLLQLLPRHSRGGSFRGITDPKAGELYLAYWKNDKKNYVVMILPWGSLQCAGLSGSLSATGLLERAPKCYLLDPYTNQIAGWNPEVEETKREFPVMYFDGRTSLGWVRAKDLSSFDFEAKDWKEIPFFQEAREYYAELRGYTSYQHMADSRSDGSPSQPQRHVGVTTISKLPVPPTEDHEMANSGTAPVMDDSDADSASKASSDSDSEMEMNTESRRTSVSNRGEAQDQGEKTAQPSNQPSPGTTEAASDFLTLAQTAQLAMAKTSPVLAPPSTDSRVGRPKGSEQGSRRVEKIYAHSNPNRSSRSPRVRMTALPDQRADAAAPQGGAPVQQPQQVPRVPSPASLQNILHSGEQPPRPAASHPPGYLNEPQDVQRGLSPLQNPLGSTEPQAARVLEAPVPVAKARIPSPLQMPTRVASQSGQATSSAPEPISKPDSRGSTPVIVRIDSAASQDRWRAIRSEPTTGSSSGSEPPRNSPQISAHLSTPNSSVPGTQPGSPNFQAKRSPTISVKPMPSIYVKRESPALGVTKEMFDVGLVRDPGNPSGMQIEERAVRMTIDPDTQVASTEPGSTTTIIVDGSKVKSILVEGSHALRIVKLGYTDGQEQTLAFRPADVGHGLQNGFIHARRFCRWLTSIDPSIEYNVVR